MNASETDHRLYLVLISVVPGTVRDEALIREHVQFLRGLDRDGRLVLAGPFTDHPGGMMVIRAKDVNEATAVAKSDPFVAKGARTVEVRTLLRSCEENNHLGFG